MPLPFLDKSGMSCVALAILIVLSALAISLSAVRCANAAPPAGYFYLQSDFEDSSHTFGVMDVANSAGMVTGFMQISPPMIPGNGSQFWKEIRPAISNGDTFRLQNAMTGQCLADASGDSDTATTRPCSDPATLWQKILERGKTRFRRTTKVSGPFADIQICPGKDVSDLGHVLTLTCYDDSLIDGVYWDETTEPLGTVSSPSTVNNPPSIPPAKPAHCSVPGGSANCGSIELTCDPLSTSNTIVVSSGFIGVKVTDVQPNLSIIIGSYLNQGHAPVAVCATKGGITACGDPIDVDFGKTVCTGTGIIHQCPNGEMHCSQGCAPPHSAQCDFKQ